MELQGIHHVTAITADAPGNVDFYARVLGLRLIKKTVNFDSPDVYHLYYGSEEAEPGSVMTFFEFPGAARGRAGQGMVHRVSWRVGSADALDFWEERLRGSGVVAERSDEGSLRFADPEGLGLELVASDSGPELGARAEGIPEEHALLGFHGVRAYSRTPAASEALVRDTLGVVEYAYDEPPAERGVQGAGTVHHVAWASRDEDLTGWRELAVGAGAHVTPVIDRDYFLSIYFREPSGVLFEIATLGPGFTVDEPLAELGRGLKLPKQHEHLRERLERTLTPLPNPRSG